MKTFDKDKLVKDNNYIKDLIKDNGDIYITKKDLLVVFPQRFVDKEFTILGTQSLVLGIIAIIDPEANKYAVLKIPGRLEMQPTEIDTMAIDDVPYYSLYFEKGMDFITNKKVIKEGNFLFDMFDNFLIKGKIPWYLEYQDLIDIFTKIGKFTGSKAGSNPLVYEILTAVIARWKEDKKVQFRNYVNQVGKIEKDELTWVGLENIWYSYSSTVNKLAGSYMELGLVSSILDPEKEVSDIEHVLRE